jgi:hypothetical protein
MCLEASKRRLATRVASTWVSDVGGKIYDNFPNVYLHTVAKHHATGLVENCLTYSFGFAV